MRFLVIHFISNIKRNKIRMLMSIFAVSIFVALTLIGFAIRLVYSRLREYEASEKRADTIIKPIRSAVSSNLGDFNIDDYKEESILNSNETRKIEKALDNLSISDFVKTLKVKIEINGIGAQLCGTDMERLKFINIYVTEELKMHRSKNVCYVNQLLYRHLKQKTNEIKIKFRNNPEVSFIMIGTVDDNVENENIIYADLDFVREITGFKNENSEYYLLLGEEKRNILKRELLEAGCNATVLNLSLEEKLETKTLEKIGKTVGIFFLLVCLLSFIVLLSSSITNLIERGGEIAIMTAIGGSSNIIFLIYLWEFIFVTIVGVISGGIIGWLILTESRIVGEYVSRSMIEIILTSSGAGIILGFICFIIPWVFRRKTSAGTVIKESLYR